ncbi:MAG: M43 family zinc metalloprotease [Chitinophagales bacterium]
MKNIFLLFSISIFSYSFLFSGEPVLKRTCATKIPTLEWKQDFRNKKQQYLLHAATQRTTASYQLPVIVHVIYWANDQNISAAQVNSQIDVLNNDYAGTGLNVGNCPAVFQPLIANTQISFCPATVDPSGNVLAEPGIERINAQTSGFSNPGTAGWSDTYIDNNVKPATHWDPEKYLNIWVLPLEDGTLGYATFPGGSSDEDGVVIGYKYYGTMGTVSSPYNKGRTVTHEVGHWLGLYHIWGDSFCGDDEINDTPTAQSQNFDCPTFPYRVNGCGAGTSPNGEMFMNFMDYVDDACMYMFTNGQNDAMHTTMTSFPMRAALATSNKCNSDQAPVANFSANSTSACPGSTINFSDLSTYSPTSWSWAVSPNSGWSFTGGTNASSQNPKIMFNTNGNFTITLTASNSFGSDAETKNDFISISTPASVAIPFSEGFQSSTFPPSGWELVSNSGFNWERTTAAGGFGTSNASMYFNNSANDAEYNRDDIVTPYIDLVGAVSPKIKFDYAYARYDATYFDTVEVLIKAACESNEVSLFKKGGSQLATAPDNTSGFVPTSSQWKRDSIAIPAAFLNKEVKFIFRNYGDWGNNVYVDNVNVYGNIVPTCVGTPTANFTSSTTSICKGGSITFTNTSTSSNDALDSVRWTISGATPSTSSSITTVNASFANVGSFTVTLKAYKCGTVSTKNATITVKDYPNVTVTSPTICSGNTATITASGATTYTWNPNIGSAATVTTPILNNSTAYTVTGTTNGCSKNATSNVTVNQTPATPSISQSNDTLNSNVIISGATYKWYLAGNLVASTSQPFYKITQSGVYTLKIEDNGCPSALSNTFNAVLTSIKNQKLDIQYSIIPNPSNGNFDLNIYAFKPQTYQLRLFNVTGQTLLEEVVDLHIGTNVKNIQLKNIEKGMYYLSIIGKEGVSTQTILIQ